MKNEYHMVGYHADKGETVSVDVVREGGQTIKASICVHHGFELVSQIVLTREDLRILRPILKHALRDKWQVGS